MRKSLFVIKKAKRCSKPCKKRGIYVFHLIKMPLAAKILDIPIAFLENVVYNASFAKTADSFKKIVIVEKSMKPRRDDKGYVMMGVKEFLLDKNSLEA